MRRIPWRASCADVGRRWGCPEGSLRRCGGGCTRASRAARQRRPFRAPPCTRAGGGRETEAAGERGRAGGEEKGQTGGTPPPLPSRTKWTSLVPPLVLTGHAAARCAGSRHLDDSGRSCPDPQTAESLEPIFVFMWGFEPRDLCRRGDSGFVHFSTPPTASLPLSAPPGVIFWLVLEESQKVLRRATKGVAQAEGSSSAAPAGKQ